jgi:hypothetical protein
MYQNCGVDFVPVNSSLESMGDFVCGSTLEAAFSKTYHPFLVSNCATCHSSIQGPRFAIGDAATAFSEFNLTTQETLKIYAENPNHGSGAGGTRHTAAIAVAEARFNSCKGGDDSGTVERVVTARTQPLRLNATATAALRSYETLDSQLELGATNLGGARLHFQVLINTGLSVPAYVITRPSLQTGTATVAVKSITIRINGQVVPAANAFNTVDRVINPNTNPLNGQTPNGNLSTGSAIFEFPGANPISDTVQFEFELLRAQ